MARKPGRKKATKPTPKAMSKAKGKPKPTPKPTTKANKTRRSIITAGALLAVGTNAAGDLLADAIRALASRLVGRATVVSATGTVAGTSTVTGVAEVVLSDVVLSAEASVLSIEGHAPVVVSAPP